MRNKLTNLLIVLLATFGTVGVVPQIAGAAVIVDDASNFTKVSSSTNLSVDNSIGDGAFTHNYANAPRFATFTYDAESAALAGVIGDQFTNVSIGVQAWNGRALNDNENYSDIFFLATSTDGTLYTPATLTFGNALNPTGASFQVSTATASTLNARYLRFTINARQITGNPESWSAAVTDVTLTTVAVPEPTTALVCIGSAGLMMLRRRGR